FLISTYNKMWKDAQRDLNIQLQREKDFPQPEKDRMKVFEMLATSYIKYMQIFQNLEMAHDQLTHQQKRTIIRQVLDGVIGRILEVKKEMVELEHTEFHYMINILEDLKLIPQNIEVPIPRYFIKDRLEILQQREKTLDEILINAGLITEKPVEVMTFAEAIKVIQVAERARQGRSRAAHIKKSYLREKRRKQMKAEDQTSPSPNPNDAAICIQKAWRGYIQRKKTKKMREEEKVFLGLRSTPPLPKKRVLQTYEGYVKPLQGEVQERNEEAFKDKLKETEGLYFKETLQNEIEQCFIECRHVVGKFPDYPAEEAGGSKSILSDTTPEQVAEKLAAKKMMELQKKDEKEKKGKDDNKKEKPKEKNPQKSEKKEEGWKMTPSNFLSIMEEGDYQYKAFWHNRDKRWDFLQDFDPEMIKDKKREEVEEEIRVQVDETMKEKVANLKLAMDGDQGDKKKKEKKGAKVRAASWRGTREPNLMSLVCRTIDSLYRELVEERLLIKAETVNLHDYIGKYNYVGTPPHLVNIGPMPSLGDIRQLIALYGILPLGSQTVHEKAPLVKALLLAGPAGVGKKMLVHAICTETGANLFNLSASNITGKYPGESDVRMMLHMVLKVAKQLQPSVVWIGETEQVFSKDAAKDEKMSLKRVEKMLPEFLKAVKPPDRVLVVGTTNRPFDANIKPFCKFYQKIILIPRPDYGSRFSKYFMLWKHFIWQNGGEITSSLNFSCLAKVSDGYTQGAIVQAVRAVLSELRLLQMNRKPLRTSEFMAPLATQDPVYREEEAAFQ
ncbi:DRC11 protein, partial [Centropus bengalensis]|nr:DRC11 protein [Centropus bengalensis]